MGKLTYAMLMIVGIQIALMLFLDVGFSGTSIYQFAVGPQGWAQMDFIDWMLTSLTIGLGAVSIGTFIYRNEFPFFVGIAAVFITFGQVYYEFYQRVASVLNPWGIPDSITVLIFIPLILPWLLIILDYTRGRD
jgi:hypothetical protein